MRSVHYLIRHPQHTGELIYPVEVDDAYQSVGSYFILGSGIDDVDRVYEFPSLHNGKVITPLIEQVGTTSIFLAKIVGIGEFRFRATKIGTLTRYSGNYTSSDGDMSVRQLAVASNSDLDRAVRDHAFLFLGQSPMIDKLR